jgi:hypothetical protein
VWHFLFINKTKETMNEKTITLNGQEVKMMYCASTENLFEESANKSIAVCLPHPILDEKGKEVLGEDGKPILEVDATIGDWLALAYAGILSVYVRDGLPVPIEYKYLLYEATPTERNNMINSITELMKQWYKEPEVFAERRKDEPKEPKKKRTKN